MLTNFRKRTALLLSVALVCASVALVPQTANAAASKRPNAGTTADPYIIPASTTPLKACPGSSASAAGFTDTTSTDVDCIKMFGVTTGKTATTYDPTGTISRQDMARFIHRMFVPTGTAAAGLTAVPAFTDIAHVDAGGTAAINALASHGITVGTTATTFSPDSNVSRQDMALFLYRFAQIAKPFNSASAGITMSIADQAYNYSDIANISFEAMEAVIGLYNAGVTGETCATVATAATCATTYRPTEDMTRAEMASMLTALLNHTNARPAGVSIQPKAAITAAAIDSWISCRNADFTPNANTLVDTFRDLVDDTSATTQAASIPFNAILNTVSTSGTGVVGPSTPGTMDTGDKLCGVLGNADGESNTMAAAKTGKWWAWTAAQGTIYVDGTTTVFLYTASLPAGATTTYATKATHAWDNTAATATNMAAITNVTATDGSNTYQGTSRVLTTTLAGTTAAAVVDGYTLKYVDKVVNYGGGTGNQSVSYVTTYVASSAGKASLTVACSADPLPLTSNAAAPGTITALEYYETHEITITFATAAAGDGWPALGSDPTDFGLMNNSTMNLSCDDVARAYPAGNAEDVSETITVSQNYADVATAGTLVSITATAYDQYGIGIAGITAQFDSITATNAALTAIAAAGAQNRGTLTTGADGTATLTAVVCTANGYVSWAVNAAGAMDAHAADVPAAGAVEGTTVYCTTPGTDTVSTQTLNANRADVQEVQTVLFFLANGSTAADPANGSYIVTYNAEAGDAIAHGASAANHHDAINSNANMVGVVVTMVGGNVGFVITFPANTGDHPMVTVAGTDLKITDGNGAAVPDANMTITETTKGVSGVTFDFVDDDLGANSITTVKTVKDRTANPGNVAVVTTWYQRWTYDSTDSFATGTGLANQSRTEAEFETANALLANLTTDVALVYRTGATTTGVSHFTVG
jgi:hypothetical protein